MQFLFSTNQWGDNFAIPAKNNNYVGHAAFMSFFTWFAGQLQLLQRTGMWATTHGERPLIHGFVTRTDAEQMLKYKPPGTFLLRFSSKLVPSLVVSISQRSNTVVHTMIEEAADGRGLKAPFGHMNHVQTFPSLSSLLLGLEVRLDWSG